MTLSSLSFGASAPPEYALDATNGCAAGSTLAAHAQCILVVRFTPRQSTASPAAAQLAVAHTALGSPQSIGFSGTVSPSALIELNTLSTFPDTAVGASSVQNLVVRNNGNAILNFGSIALADTSGVFSRAGDCSVTSPLPIGQSCTIALTFRPLVTGLASTQLSIVSNASNVGTATLSLVGTGVPPFPKSVLDPTSIDFGSQTVGGAYPTRQVTISNPGTANLIVASVAAQGAGFAIASGSACVGPIAPQVSCTIAVAFSPTTIANTTGSVVVTTNAANSPQAVALTGSGTATAVPSLVWMPAISRLEFPATSAGTLSAVQSTTLRNNGPGGVRLAVVNVVGNDAVAFAILPGSSTQVDACPLTTPLFEGRSCRIDIVFSPGSAGTKTATLQVASDGNAPPVLTLAGTGVGGPVPDLLLPTTGLAFENTQIGAQANPQEVSISATGSGTVQVTAMETTGPFVLRPKSCAAVPFSLAAGSSCTMTVTFQPQSEGATTGLLRVTSSASTTTRDVGLSGIGTPRPVVSAGGGGGGGGGCSLASGDPSVDPTLWLLCVLALAGLAYREHIRRLARMRQAEGRGS